MCIRDSIRRKYGVNILGVKRNGKTDVNISPETVLDADMTLLVLSLIHIKMCIRDRLGSP